MKPATFPCKGFKNEHLWIGGGLSKPDTLRTHATHKVYLFASHARLCVTESDQRFVRYATLRSRTRQISSLLNGATVAGYREEGQPCFHMNVSSTVGRACRNRENCTIRKGHHQLQSPARTSEIGDNLCRHRGCRDRARTLVSYNPWRYRTCKLDAWDLHNRTQKSCFDHPEQSPSKSIYG